MSRHNRRQELIEEKGYCECRISSPSSHHDCCINPGCSKVIKTIYEKYEELEAEQSIDHEWNLYHDNQNRNYHDVARIEKLEEYVRKMSDPNNKFYISHSKEYEVKNLDGTTRKETVHYIKDIQQMAKDAKLALEK